VSLIGNLVRDPEYRETGSGICKFTVAVTDGYGDTEHTSYIPIVVFGKQSQSCSKYLAKGSKVCVSGRIQTGSYEKDGHKVYTTDIIATRVEFLSSRGNSLNEAEKPVTDEIRASEGYSQMSYDDVPF
jgi:single-strand DNA-binding protein